MIVRDEITGSYQGIKCEVCDTLAPSQQEILKGNGLVNMGWHCSSGLHYCPEHAKDMKK